MNLPLPLLSSNRSFALGCPWQPEATVMRGHFQLSPYPPLSQLSVLTLQYEIRRHHPRPRGHGRQRLHAVAAALHGQDGHDGQRVRGPPALNQHDRGQHYRTQLDPRQPEPIT